MKFSWLGLAALGLVFVVVATAAPPKPENGVGGLFAGLEKGQKVSLKETAHGFEIGVVPGAELGFKITEIGQDYLVLEDLAGMTETRIPVYAIKSVRTTRLPKR